MKPSVLLILSAPAEVVREALPALLQESPVKPHRESAIDEAMAIDDEGTALGRVLDLFLFREIRGDSVRTPAMIERRQGQRPASDHAGHGVAE